MIRSIITNNSCLSCQNLTRYYSNMSNDITLTTNNNFGNNNNITSILLNWQGYSDFSLNMYQGSNCQSQTKDQWSQSQSKCFSNYSYLIAGSSTLGTPNCLLFTEWSSNQESSRYNNAPSNCVPSNQSDFSTFLSANNAYYNSITKYVSDNNNLLNKLIQINNQLETSFGSMITQLLFSMNDANGVTTPLLNIYLNKVGSSSLFSLINCSIYFLLF